jgi:uncharacterized protein
MVKVKIVYRGKDLESLEIKGHAGFAPYGEDLVCGAVSIASFGALNALEAIDDEFDYELDQEAGLISLEAKGKLSEHDATVLEVLILQLKTVEASYPKNIAITERKQAK